MNAITSTSFEKSLQAHYDGVSARLGLRPAPRAVCRAKVPPRIPERVVLEGPFSTPIDFLRTRGVAFIVDYVAARYGVAAEEILSERRTADCTRARQMAMYLAFTHGPYSLAHLGRAFGRDHTTVLHSIRRVRERNNA